MRLLVLLVSLLLLLVAYYLSDVAKTKKQIIGIMKGAYLFSKIIIISQTLVCLFISSTQNMCMHIISRNEIEWMRNVMSDDKFFKVFLLCILLK